MKQTHALLLAALLASPAVVLAAGEQAATTGNPGTGNQGCTAHDVTYKNPGKLFQAAREQHGNPSDAAAEEDNVGDLIEDLCGEAEMD